MKTRFRRDVAVRIAEEICDAMRASCERLVIAGSLRRMREEVGDVEIVYIPKFGLAKCGGLFEEKSNLAEMAIAQLEARSVLVRRLNVNGSELFGKRNKLMRHTLSGIPVDLFSATENTWANYLVCRTGSSASNIRIAQRAKESGYKWNPYGDGFTRLSDGQVIPVDSERAVFEFLNLPYREPQERT